MSMSVWWRMPFIIQRRVLNNRLYIDPEELIRPFIPREFQKFLQTPFECSEQPQLKYDNKAADSGAATTVYDKDKFQASLDVQHYKPDEITVKVNGNNTIIVEGKHEEQPENGFISRQFVRQYVLPHGHDVSKIESKLSSDGVLTITAPKLAIEDDARTIPITQTGEEARSKKKTDE